MPTFFIMDLDDQLIQAKTGRRIPAMLAGRLDEADKFPAWRDELIRLLRIFDLDKYITTDVPKPDDEEQGMQWEMDRAEVKDYLLDYIGPNVLAGLQLTDRSAVHVPDPKEIFDTIAHSIEGFLAARKDRRAQESKTASAPSQPPEQSNCSAEHFHTVCLDLERERIAGRRLQQLAATSWQKLEALKQATVSIVAVHRGGSVLVADIYYTDAQLVRPRAGRCRRRCIRCKCAWKPFYSSSVQADSYARQFDAMLDFARGPTRCGELAAASLESTVQQYLQSVDPSVAGSPIMTKAFASGEGLEGLATLLAQLGIAGRREDAQTGLAKFACGFSQARDMFDFVLVGEDKDRVNSKLMGLYSLLSNALATALTVG